MSLGNAVGAQQQPYFTPVNDNANFVVITAASYTLSFADLGRLLIFNSSSAQTLTLPASLGKGFYCSVLKINTGALTVAAGTGATLNSPLPSNVFTTRYGMFDVLNYDTSTYVIAAGDLPNLGSAVASAAAIVPTGRAFHVTGTTTITSITGTAVKAGTTITIIFDGILTFTDGSNLKIAGDFTTSADDTITLTWDGTNWYENARSVN